jgi:hypothetical protein
MSAKPKTQGEYYDIFKTEVQSLADEFSDWSDGSMNDIISGALSVGMNELSRLIVTEFSKTFFNTARGDDLEFLATDHFGDQFAKPQPTNATGKVKFQRPTTNAGDVTINTGTIVKTRKDSQGQEQRFSVKQTYVLTGLEIEAEVEAVIPGSPGNVAPNRIVVIENALTDQSVTVNNFETMAGGTDSPDDAEYRELIRARIQSLKGATEEAIRGALLALPNIAFASLVTETLVVRRWDIASNAPDGDFFRIPYPIAYVADQNGNSSLELAAQGAEAIEDVRAAGVKIEVRGAFASPMNWVGTITLNASGDNYASLSSNPQPIIDSMAEYLNKQLEIGEGFVREDARAYVMSIWGAAGSGDLSDFQTLNPVGDVAGQVGVKLTAGGISLD